MYEFPSGNFLFVKSEVVITSRKVGQADNMPNFRDMTIWCRRKQCSVVCVCFFDFFKYLNIFKHFFLETSTVDSP